MYGSFSQLFNTESHEIFLLTVNSEIWALSADSITSEERAQTNGVEKKQLAGG